MAVWLADVVLLVVLCLLAADFDESPHDGMTFFISYSREVSVVLGSWDE